MKKQFETGSGDTFEKEVKSFDDVSEEHFEYAMATMHESVTHFLKIMESVKDNPPDISDIIPDGDNNNE